VLAGDSFKDLPVDGSDGSLRSPLSQLLEQILKSPVIRMLRADSFESSVCNGVSFFRIGQKIINALGEFIRTIEYDDFLTDAKILFKVLSGFSEQATTCTWHFEYARLDLTATVRQQPSKLNARVSEVQGEYRLTVDTQKIRGRDWPCGPTVTEALDVDASGT
jgi:hypothetical protein